MFEARCDGVITLLFLSAFCDLFSVAQTEATNPSYSLINLGLAARSSHDITLSALRTTERLKFWGLSNAL